MWLEPGYREESPLDLKWSSRRGMKDVCPEHRKRFDLYAGQGSRDPHSALMAAVRGRDLECLGHLRSSVQERIP